MKICISGKKVLVILVCTCNYEWNDPIVVLKLIGFKAVIYLVYFGKNWENSIKLSFYKLFFKKKYSHFTNTQEETNNCKIVKSTQYKKRAPIAFRFTY